MKSLLVYLVSGLLLFVSVAALGLPYNSTTLSETLTLLPEVSGGSSATFMIYHGNWYAMSSASLSVKDSLSVTHMLDVGVSLGDYVSVSCNAFQMPKAGNCRCGCARIGHAAINKKSILCRCVGELPGMKAFDVSLCSSRQIAAHDHIDRIFCALLDRCDGLDRAADIVFAPCPNLMFSLVRK